MASKRNKVKSSPKGTPWDIVNIFGYALGVPRDVLAYDMRDSSKYSVSWCSSNPTLKKLRSACMLRALIIRDYDRLASAPLWQNARGVNKRFKQHVADVLGEESTSLKLHAYLLLNCVQDVIEGFLIPFTEQLPDWCPITPMLAKQFRFSFGRMDEASNRCKDLQKQLVQGNHSVLMADGLRLSTRVLRDDRDLCEELCALYGEDVSKIRYPYSRTLSNRRAHMERLRTFCEEHGPVVVEVDTENVEASLAVAFLRNIEEELPGAMSQVNLYLSGMENKTWRYLSEFIQTEVNVKEVTRIREHKSSMDTAVIASILSTKYSGKGCGVLLLSSDCDFLVLNEQVPDMPVCYCCVRQQAAAGTLKYLKGNKLPAVYLDYVVNNLVLARAEQFCVVTHLANTVNFQLPNVYDIAINAVEAVCPSTRVSQYTRKLDELFEGMSLNITCDGTVVAAIREERMV